VSSYFFDTSALVKRYHEEEGTDSVDEILDQDGVEVLISSLTVIETVSAFRRKYNRGEISESEMEQLISVFFQEALDEFVILPLEESLLNFSFELVLEDDLRTLDSMQLSAALSLAQEMEDLVFVTADEDLAKIGKRHTLETVVPQS
jgi:predicted nucleic acid-binding protein